MNIPAIGRALTGAYRTMKATARGARHGWRAGKAAKEFYGVKGLQGAKLQGGLALSSGKAALAGSVKKRAPALAAHVKRHGKKYAAGAGAAAVGGAGFAAGRKRERKHMMRGLR